MGCAQRTCKYAHLWLSERRQAPAKGAAGTARGGAEQGSPGPSWDGDAAGEGSGDCDLPSPGSHGESHEPPSVGIRGPAVTAFVPHQHPHRASASSTSPSLGEWCRAECGGRSRHLPTNPISWWAGAGLGHWPKKTALPPLAEHHFIQQPWM